MAKLVKPTLPGGVRDYLPKEMIARQNMLDTIRMCFERYGFVPLDTPCIERLEVLVGGESNFDSDIYTLRGTRDRITAFDDSTRALRFDFTVPLARVIASSPDLILPLKRYQTGKAFRGEKAQAGRFNEFVQFDADTIGVKSVQADAEIVAIIYATLAALQIPNFVIGVSNRKVLNGLPTYASFDTEILPAVLRILDKQKKIGNTAVENMLVNGDDISGVEGVLDWTQASKVMKFLKVNDLESNEKILDRLSELLTDPVAQEGIQELRDINYYLQWYNVPSKNWEIDLTVIRGLGYYTGPVFETYLQDLPEIGSVFSGGRFDGLVERFSPSSVPATGASVGVDRLFAALEKLNLIPEKECTADVIILPFGDTNDIRKACAECASYLRENGINTEVYLNLGTPKELIGQAAKRGVPVAVIIGENEVNDSVITIKNMRDRTQVTAPLKPAGVPRVEGALQKIKDMLR